MILPKTISMQYVPIFDLEVKEVIYLTFSTAEWKVS